MKKLITIFLLLVTAYLQAQAPLNFSARLNVTNITGSNPYTLTGVIQDELGKWSASDLNVSADSIYHLEGTDLLIYRIVSITLASGNNFIIVVDDIMDSGLLPSTGSEWAVMEFTTAYQFPMEVGNLASPLKSSIDNRFKQRLDTGLTAASGGGGATNLTFTGSTSPYTLNSDTGTDVTFVQGANTTLSRSGNALTIAAASPPVTGVNDKANMIDVTLNGSSIEVDPDISEGTSLGTYAAADEIMVRKNSDGTHYKAALGTYLANGFVTLGTPAQTITTDKNFTGSLWQGSVPLPTSSAFGSTSATNSFFAPTSTAITESNFQNSQGLIIHNFATSSILPQTLNIIAAGTDAGGGQPSSIAFKVRPAGEGLDWIQPLKIMSSNIVLCGGATAGAAIGGQLQVNGSNGGQIGYVGGFNNWLQGTVNSSSSTFFVQEDGVTRAHIDSGTNGWVSGSDIRLKDNIETLSVLPYINGLRGVKYTLRDSGKPAIGVIAQELEKDFPETCSLPSDPAAMKGVNYNGVAAMSLQGVKELYELVQQMQVEIAGLKKEIEALKSK